MCGRGCSGWVTFPASSQIWGGCQSGGKKTERRRTKKWRSFWLSGLAYFWALWSETAGLRTLNSHACRDAALKKKKIFFLGSSQPSQQGSANLTCPPLLYTAFQSLSSSCPLNRRCTNLKYAHKIKSTGLHWSHWVQSSSSAYKFNVLPPGRTEPAYCTNRPRPFGQLSDAELSLQRYWRRPTEITGGGARAESGGVGR